MSARRPLVLMYHGVDRVSADRDPHGMFVHPTMFRAQVEALLEKGFVPISERAYVDGIHGGSLPRRAVLLTFDDGYLGVGEYALPVLESFGVPSVLYMPSDLVGGCSQWLERRHRHPLMSGPELRSLAARGMAVGAHGADHRDLTQTTDAELWRHTADTRRSLTQLLGKPVLTFAYPYGRHDARVRRAVGEAGYRAGFAVHEPAGDLAVGRVDINALDTMRTFGLKLRPWYPAARRATDCFPAVRRRAHDLLGTLPREQCDAADPRVGAP